MAHEQPSLQKCCILVVEDEFLLAEDISNALHELGGDVMGPVPDLDGALAAIEGRSPDLAVLDINLRGEMVFPLADELRRRNIPFVFATGYSGHHMPMKDYATVPCWRKPYDSRQLARLLATMTGA